MPKGSERSAEEEKTVKYEWQLSVGLDGESQKKLKHVKYQHTPQLWLGNFNQIHGGGHQAREKAVIYFFVQVDKLRRTYTCSVEPLAN